MSDTLQKIINRNAAKLSSKKQQMSTVTLSTPPKDGGFFEDLYVALQQGFDAGFSVNEAFDVYKKGANISDVELQAYIDAVANMDESKITNEQYMFQKAVKENGGGFFGGMKALFENPGYLPQLIVTSGATMLGSLIDSEEVAGFTALGAGIGAGTGATLTAVSGPGALFGAAGGAIGGAFTGLTGAMETSLTLTDLLRDELGDKKFTKENIRAILEDKESVERLKNRSLARGMTIGMVEGLTMGLSRGVGSKILTTTTRTGSKIGGAKTALKIGGATSAIEMAGGGTGELLGQVAAGQEIKGEEIFLEAIAEGKGVVNVSDIISSAAKPTMYKLNGEFASKKEIESVLNDKNLTPEELLNINIEVENDVNLQNKITNAKARANIKKNIDKSVTNESDLNDLIDLEIQRRNLQNSKKNKKGAFKPLNLDKKIEDNQNKIDDILSKYEGITSEQVTDITDRAIVLENYKKDIAFADKYAGIFNLKLSELENEAAINKYIKDNNLSTEDAEAIRLSNGFVNENTGEIIINKQKALETQNVNVGNHELLHGVLKKAVQDKKIGEKLINDLRQTLGKDFDVVDQKIKEGKYSDNYMKENPDEYITLLSESILEGKIKPNQSILSKIADLFTPILRALGFKKIKFDTAEDTLSFLREYHKSIRTGKLSNAIIKATQLNEATAGTKIKRSMSPEARQQISDNVQEIGDTYSFEGGKKAWDEGGADNAITEIKQSNYLDDLIAAKFKGDRVPVDFVDKVYTELTSHIRNFNPETNDNLFGWINSQIGNKAGNVFNREYKTTVEQRTAKDVDDRTKEGEVKVQVAAEKDVALQELEEQDISPQAEARRKREAAKKEEPTKSQLRQEIGIEDGSDAYNAVLETARKVLIRAYDAGKTARQIQRDLTKEASTYLFKQVKNMLGTKAKYIPTIKKLRVALVNSMFTADLVQMERNVADDQRVFTKFVGKLTSKQEVQDAVDNNLLPPSALNTIDKGQSVNLYEKVMPTEEQFVSFFDQPLINPKTGVRSGLRGTRKDQLAKHVAASLNFDATMQVAQEPEVAEKRQQIAELRGETIDNNDIQILSATINRKPNLKFSKSSGRPVVSQNLAFHLEKVFRFEGIKNKKLTQKDVEKYAENLTYKISGQGVTIGEAMSNKDKKAFKNYALGVLRSNQYATVVDTDLRSELLKGYKKAIQEGKVVNSGILNEQKGTKVLNENTQNSKVVKGSGDTYIQLFNTIFGFEHKLGDAQWVSRTFNFVKGKFVPTTENTTENFNEDISKLIKEKVFSEVNAFLQDNNIEAITDPNNLTSEQTEAIKAFKDGFQVTTEVSLQYVINDYINNKYSGDNAQSFLVIEGNVYLMPTESTSYENAKIVAKHFNNLNPDAKIKPLQLVDDVSNITVHVSAQVKDTGVLNFRMRPKLISKNLKSSEVNIYKDKNAAKKLGEAMNLAAKEIQNIKSSKSVRNARPVLQYSKTSRGMSAFDFDETLIDKGENFIIATSPQGKEIKITSGQWPIQGPKLAEQGYTFDFKDFVNVRGGVDGPLLQKLKNRIKKYGAKNNYILTARPPSSATAIHGWLKTKGINIPLENITGLGNSTGEAKAMWIAGKYSEGYNDIYFVDDALPNVEAVKNVLNQLDVKGKSVQAKIKFSKSIKNTLNKNKSYVKFKNSLKNSVFYHGGLSSLKNKNAVWFIVDDVNGAEVYSDIRGVMGEVYSVKASQLKDSIIIPDVNDSFGFDKIIKQKFPDQVKALVDDGQVKIDKILKQDNAAEIISEYMNWANNNFELFEGVYGPKTLYDNSGKIAKSLPVIVLDTDVSSKAKEVKPSTKFSKSSLRGNKTVKNVFDQLDIKGKSVQTKIKFSKSLNKDFNDIIEDVKGIDSKKRFSEAKGRARGKGKGRFRFFIPPSHEDFVGLLYNFIGKGEKGNKHRDFFEKALIKPLNRAFRELNVAKQAIANDYRALVKGMPEVRKRLGEKILKGDYTVEDAIRVYLFNKAGYEVPGLTKTDLKNLVEFVKSDPMIQSFADTVGEISRVKEGYISPGDSWQASNIRYDLVDATGRVGRAKFFAEYQENADIIFSDENMNKIRAAFGDNFVEALQDMLYRIKTGSNRPAGNNRIVNRFLDWINGSVGATMFFNARSAVLQTLSTVNFINFADNNIFKAAAAFANQKQFWSDFAALFNSDFLKQRRSGAAFDVNANEIAREVAGSKNPMLAAIKYLLNVGFLPTQLADSFAIASGGATFYRNRIKTYLKQGFSQQEAESKAFIDFQEIAEATQQSARGDMVSQQQTSTLGRIILAFQNVTAQYARIIKKSGLDLINRRKSKGYTNQAQSDAANISRIIYYGAIQSIIFNALQNALFAMMFDEDEEDEEKTKKFFETKKQRVINGTIDSLLKGSGVGGAIISTLKNYAIKLTDNLESKSFFKTPAWEELLQLSPPIGIKIRKIARAERNLEWNKDVLTELPLDNLDNPIYDISTAYIEGFTNIPVARLLRKVQNISAALDSENKWWQRVAVGAGWSRWDVGITDDEIKETKKAIRENNKRIEKETKLKKATPEEKLKIIEKEAFDLNKREQEKILENNNLNPKDYKLEKDRVEAIMKLRVKNEKKIDKQISDIKNYVPTKSEQRSIDLFKMNKKDQVNTLIDLGLSSKQIKELKYEEDRVNKIIELQDKKKSKKR